LSRAESRLGLKMKVPPKNFKRNRRVRRLT